MNEKDSKFSRVLSKKDVLVLSFGAMIGWGWIVLAGHWITTAGSLGAIIAFAIGGIMVLFIGLTYAELTSMMPKCGGEHVFSHRALGRTMSFICTWSIILGYVAVVAFVATSLPIVTEYIFPGYVQGYLYTIAGYDIYFTWLLLGVGGAALITFINYIGIKPAAFFQGMVTVLILIVGIIFFTGAFVYGDISNLQPLFVNENTGIWVGIMVVLIMTPFMFVGFDVIPQSAEEINMPFAKIGKLLVLSVFIAIAWYILIIYAVSVALTPTEIAASDLATADAMKALFFGSPWAATLIIIAGIGGILTSWNAFLVGGSRAIYAMAQSKMLPSFLAVLHPKYKTPVNAILLIGLISALAPFFGRPVLIWLVNAGGLLIVLAYFIVAISFLVLRYKEPAVERPYKVKCGKLVGVLAALLSFGMMILYMPTAPAALGWPEWLIVLGWTALGVVFFVWAKITNGGNGTCSKKV
ncbi:MAG: APC family permease [Desulfotomaculum sp.]|nr:APC family permease [Desulfotomaculum sp.]